MRRITTREMDEIHVGDRWLGGREVRWKSGARLQRMRTRNIGRGWIRYEEMEGNTNTKCESYPRTCN